MYQQQQSESQHGHEHVSPAFWIQSGDGGNVAVEYWFPVRMKAVISWEFSDSLKYSKAKDDKKDERK